MKENPIIHLVDDNSSFRNAMIFLLQSYGFSCISYDSGESFLENFKAQGTDILLLDVKMPGMTGTELQAYLNQQKKMLPIIFLSGHGDLEMAVRTMMNGAVTFLQKPVIADKLLEAISIAKKKIQETNQTVAQPTAMSVYQSLSAREKQITDLTTKNLTTRIISERLGISQRTVEFHKASAMRKFQVHSTDELIKVVKEALSQ